MPAAGSFDSFASILGGMARRLGLESKLTEFRLRRQWAEIVGPQVAAHTRPDQIRFKKLHLLVRNSVWLHQLTFLKPDLLAKINAEAGGEAVTDIVLRIGDFGPADEDVQRSRLDLDSRPSDFDPRTALEHEAAAHAEAVKDPELRAQLAAVMAQALSLPEKPRSPRQSAP
ncbi:DUF721 domain-containing protein [Nitrospira calida]|jgi:hypothetical protein